MGKRIPIILGLLLVSFGCWLQLTSQSAIQHVLNGLQSMAYDIRLSAYVLTHPLSYNPTVNIIDIDDKALQEEGRWPWPRTRLALLINKLHQLGAVVIALDIILPETEENIADSVFQEIAHQNLVTPNIKSTFEKITPYFNTDAVFAKSLLQGDNVLGISFLPRPETQGTLPAPILHLSDSLAHQLSFITARGYIGANVFLKDVVKNMGFINVFPDEDGVIRRVPLLIRYQNDLYPSLALEAVRTYLLSNISLITATYDNSVRLEGIQVGNHVIPTDIQAQAITPFIGKSFTFPYFSASDVLHDRIPAETFKGKILFIGTSATGLGDIKTTSIQTSFPGVEVEASMAEGILMDSFSYKPDWALGAEISLTIVLGTLLAGIFPFLGPRSLITGMIFIPCLLAFFNNWLWNKTGLLISTLVPVLMTLILAITNMGYGYFFETRKRERIKEMFGQYVPEKHIEAMIKTSSNYGLQGEEREMTVLFADIRNFTTLSEHMTASQLKDMLNRFLTPMTEIIFKYQGTIDKYVGDLIMAFWGAPLKDKHHAEHAIHAALDMQLAVANLHSAFALHGWPDIKIGIGLNSGIMNVGDMGSQFRRNYTVLGDEVNLASRVEGLTKYYGVNIILTENTRHHQKNFIFRQLDNVRVKGKKQAITIYEVICPQINLTSQLEEELEQHDKALNEYLNQQWQSAKELFHSLHIQHPKTKIYKLYIDRITEFEHTPPPANWDGVYTHAEK